MPRNKTYDNVAQAIGDTPMIRINRLVPAGGATVFAKCEFFNPLSSVKDRIGVAMIEAGERDGKIKHGHATSSSRPAATRASRWRSSAPPRATS